MTETPDEATTEGAAPEGAEEQEFPPFEATPQAVPVNNVAYICPRCARTELTITTLDAITNMVCNPCKTAMVVKV